MTSESRPVEPASPATRPIDEVGDRIRLVTIGVVAVLVASVIFGAARAVEQLKTGRLTPWWINAFGALAMLAVLVWVRWRPNQRSTAPVHATALVAVLSLLVPVAYGMVSSIWWLSLVGFAAVLLGRRREAWLWGIGVPLVVIAAVFLEPYVQLEGAAGEATFERIAAPIVFCLMLVGMAAAFRRVANQRATALAETAASLERANAARGRFLAHISHEIRTPLHGVISMTDLALHSELPAAAREHVSTAQQSARVLLGLLNNVLDVTRAEADALELEQSPFSIHAALHELLRPLAAQAREKGLAFSALSDPNVAERRIGDRFRVSQVVLNLVSNALKFTERGSVRVHLATVPGKIDWVRIEVNDTGRGIDPNFLPTIFEPFAQASAADAAVRSGTGLGLTIVRELVRRMKGQVEVESKPGRGSRFVATFALDIDPANPGILGPTDLLAERTAPLARHLGRESARRLVILVCEDDTVNQLVVEMMLQRLGHEVSVVPTAEEALQQLGTRRFDVLLTDIELPGMDGLELARQVRALERASGRPRLPIIGGTAHVGEDERHRLIAAGIDLHLPKPFDLADLGEALQSVLAPPVEAALPAGA